ncbi:hypothetical protein KCU78_g18770, partial [Aureobasidium melanogenum]
MAGRLSRPGTRDGLFQNNNAIMDRLENRGENEWEYHDREGVSLDDDVDDSPASESMDEYDEFAQSIRISQRQASSSPQPDQSDEENDHVESSSRTSTHSSQHNPDIEMLNASLPSGRQQSSHQLPTTQMLGQDAGPPDYAVADSQPTRHDETQLPPPLVEPSSMSSFVPGSYPLSQMTQRLNALKRDAADSSSIPKPPPTTSQVAPHTQNRLPSSPPQLPVASEEIEQGEALDLRDQSRPNDGHTGVSSPLPETRPAPSQRTKELREVEHNQSSAVLDTDPADENRSSNQHRNSPVNVKLIQQSLSKPIASTDKDVSPAVPSASQFEKHRASQLQTQSQVQSSISSTESPRKAAGILNFADIATDPTPPNAVSSKDLDMNIDILSNDDHDFMDIMTSPPAKKMRLYGKKARVLERARSKPDDKSPAKPQATIKSPVKPVARTVTFHDDVVPDNKHDNIAEVAIDTADTPQPTDQPELKHSETASTIDPNSQTHEPVETSLAKSPEETHEPSIGQVVAELPNRPGDTVQIEAVVDEQKQKDSVHSRQPTPTDDQPQSTPSSARKREQAGASAATKARETMLAQQNNSHNENVVSSAELTQPDRVLALFKGTGQAYYPATCLGAATLDGLKLRVRFDDGTITQLDSFLVRRLDLRRGDQVKVDLQGMRSKIYVVVGFQDRVENVEPESYPKTDVHGFETLQLVVKDRDSVSALPREGSAALLQVPVTSAYLTQTMWVRFEGRNYLPSTASMTTIATGHSSRPQTPVPQNTTLATPASRSRRGT